MFYPSSSTWGCPFRTRSLVRHGLQPTSSTRRSWVDFGVGTVADVGSINLRKGDFGFVDVRGTKLKGTQKLEAELTIRGERLWDLNGISAPAWDAK